MNDKVKEELRSRINRARDDLSTREIRKRKYEEKAAVLKKEAESKAAAAAELTAKVEAARLRLRALKGEEVRVREREYLPFAEAAARVNPVDALLATKKKLLELESILDKNSIMKELPSYVDVHFNAYVCSFGLTRTTTFEGLKEEACAHWGVDVRTAQLKNANDVNWKATDNVQLKLAEAYHRTGAPPLVRLHLLIDSSQSQPKLKVDDTDAKRKRKRSKAGEVLTAVAENSEGNEEASAESDVEWKQTREFIRQKEKEAWEAAVMQLSPFFHDAEYVVKLDPNLESNIPFNRQRYFKVRLARTCLWLILWMATVCLCIAGMIFRFNTATAYSSVTEIYTALGFQQFCVPFADESIVIPTELNSSVTVPLGCSQGAGFVRQFGGIPSSSADYLNGIPPDHRILNIAEVSYWMQDVLFPSLKLGKATNTSLGSTGVPSLVSPQTVLLGNLSISYAQASPAACNGFFYQTMDESCPCYRDYDPNSIDTTACVGPLFQFLSTTPLEDATGVLRPVYWGDGCEAIVDQSAVPLIEYSWLNPGTRVVLFQFNLLNLNLGSVTETKLIVEVGPSELVVTSIQVRVLPLSVYSVYTPQYEALLIVSDVFLFLYALAAVWFWVIRPRVQGVTSSLFHSLKTVWNLLAVLLFLVVVAQIGLGIGYELSIAKTIDLQPSSFQNLSSQIQAFYAYLGLSTVSLFLLILCVFKHLQANFKISKLFQTVHRASRPLGALIFMLVLALASMSLWAHLAWGGYLIQWARIENSVALLAGMLFGAPMDFASLRETQNTLLWVVFFFLLWVGFAILLLLQLFGAVVLDAYLEVEAVSLDRQANEEQIYWTKLLTSPFAWLERSSINKRKRKISQGIASFVQKPWRRFIKRVFK